MSRTWKQLQKQLGACSDEPNGSSTCLLRVRHGVLLVPVAEPWTVENRAMDRGAPTGAGKEQK